MRIFVTGTDTNIGKTIVCSWLCIHTGYSYYKPIQTGLVLDSDSKTLLTLAKTMIYPPVYEYNQPLSPHLAASINHDEIDVNKIRLPLDNNLIVEGAGGVLVPLNDKLLMIDLIKKFDIPTIIVASSLLGTINHTLLTIEALRSRNINILGVIMNGPLNDDNKKAIEYYAKVPVIAQIPKIVKINSKNLQNIPVPYELKNILLK